MTLLLDDATLAARRAVVAGELQPLASSILADLQKVIARPLYVPEQKALLSREGGRCPRDGAMLDFDPFAPHEHRCPKCGSAYSGELHDRFWIYWYQLWLAERAVHAATLDALMGMPDALRFARSFIEAYADRYPTYPNVDNALGPTRPFFSTYLESIWLLQLCLAADLIELRGSSPATNRFRDAVVEPSLALIQSFDEGLSNRQVWNNAALIAGHRLLGNDREAEAVVWARHGVVSHLSSALLADGTWYEGENYHFFAHRGLWYCMELVSRMDAGISPELVARYAAGFRAPFLTMLPDLTFPSRRDSQYAVSFRQWRFAEMCELGCACSDDRTLRSILSRLYGDDLPRGDTGRWKSTAEAERNLPPTRLDRSDLGWKSLLFARPSIALDAPAPLPSVLLDAQGIGVIRRNAGRVYVALDYGVSGGGHGHPDRLNLLISDGEKRVLDDMGTGSYVDPSLHWYRSTLAHNAPMLDGRSQARVDGELLAFDDRGGAGWMSAQAAIAVGARATRTVVVMPEYLIDEVAWTAPGADAVFDLPIHIDVQPESPRDDAESGLNGSDALEDGFRFLREARCLLRLAPGTLTRLSGAYGAFWLAADREVEIWGALAPGAPGSGDRRMTLVRARAGTGTIRWAWSWTGAARAGALFPHPSIAIGSERHEHLRVEHGWQVAIHVANARSTIDLAARATANEVDGNGPMRVSPPFTLVDGTGLSNHSSIERVLGESSYRRSEQSWAEADLPTARLTLRRDDDRISTRVSVIGDRSFVPPGQLNRLDNEPADINGAGLQLYLMTGQRRAGYVVIPQAGSNEISIRPIDGWGAAIPVEGQWRPTDDGYEVDLTFRSEPAGFALDLVVNEKPMRRERRRGQLVLSGGLGQFIYLRGDRHDPHRLISFGFIDD
jgi:hypothetical protein